MALSQSCVLVVTDNVKSLVGMASKGKESLGHRLKVPNLGATASKRLFPLGGKMLGHVPAKLIVTETGADHVASLIRLSFVNKAFAAMQDGKVVDEVNVPRLGCDFKLCGPGDFFYSIKRLNLDRRQLRQVIGPRVAGAAHQRSSTKIGNQLAILKVNNRSAVELGTIAFTVSHVGSLENSMCLLTEQMASRRGQGLGSSLDG